MLNTIPRYLGKISVCCTHLEATLSRFGIHKRNAMTDKVEQHWISRLNNQVNYKRKFHSPEKVEVLIPTLPYQAFDLYLSGTRVKPWNLIDLIVSVRLFTQYPVKHAGGPEDSIVDTHLLQKHNFLFAIALKLHVNRTFHDPESPKFPLVTDAEVTHVGSSSTRRLYTIKHPDGPMPYITCTVDDVLVNKISRQPTAFPEWWKQKYAHLKKEKERFQKPMKTLYSFESRHEFRVEFEHMDHNLHTTMSAYLKFCMNTAFKTVVSETHQGPVNSEYLRAGVKSVQMLFHSESNYGDTLFVEMFENNSKVNEVYFEIKKKTAKQGNEKECCTVVLEFYEPLNKALNGKL